jgi:glycosyltransferase involved in cell wall biosynthesis
MSGDLRLSVLHVSPYFAPAYRYGGPPRSILGLCRALSRAGARVEACTTTADGSEGLPPSPPDGEVVDGIRVHRLPLTRPRRVFAARGMASHLARRLDTFDLVHVHGLWHAPGWLAARAARRRARPYVVSPRGMLDPASLAHHAWRKRLLYGLLERRHLAGASLLHATSETEALALGMRGLGVDVAMVPNGVDLPEPPAARGAFRQTLGLTPAQPLIVFLGRIHPIKRLDLVAQALDRVRAERPDACLVLAGPDEGGHRRRLAPLFQASAAAVRWLGTVTTEQRQALLADATALLLCSDSESFGLAVAEGLAAGVPVVTTRTVPWRVVADAGCGFWVPQSAEAVAEALLALVADPDAARRMGQRGRTLVRDRYGWETVARAMLDRYRMLIAGPREAAVR